MVSDIVLLKELPESFRNDVAGGMWGGCTAGASRKEEYLAIVAKAGFQEVEIVAERASKREELVGFAASVNVSAIKPK